MIRSFLAPVAAPDPDPRLKSGAIRFCPSGTLKAGIGVALLLALTGCFKRGVTPIRTHFNQGVYHYSHGEYEIAISEYRMALEERADDYHALFNLAEALESRATRLERDGQDTQAEALRREAEEHYRALLADDAGHLRASVNLAAREFHAGQQTAAEARLRSAIEKHPRSTLPRVALAAHRFDADNPAAIHDAITLLEEALEQDRANTDANVLLGHAYAALHRHSADPDLVSSAREAYQHALDHVPGDVGALIGLARLEHRAGKIDRAESLARRAIYILPDLLEAHLMLADLLEARGQLEDATVHLWRSRQLEGSDHPHLAPEDYRQRLLDLYRRLAQQEGAERPTP